MKIYRLNSEWDIGEEGLLFASHGAAYAWLANNASVQEMIGPKLDFKNVSEMFDEGLLSFTEMKVIE
jgi:hypothetical protein